MRLFDWIPACAGAGFCSCKTGIHYIPVNNDDGGGNSNRAENDGGGGNDKDRRSAKIGLIALFDWIPACAGMTTGVGTAIGQRMTFFRSLLRFTSS